ncbi:MAG: glycosyltransferase, partial [Bacteroidetes bacterium]|nr:glycosyltransferase [Bacteroidota bacterium]
MKVMTMNSNEPIIISAEEASESVFCFLGEFGYELISWLPYLLFLKGKRGIKLNTVSRIGSKVFYYFSDSHHEVEGRLIGDMWGEPEKYYHLQSVFNGKRIIHPGPDFINKKKIIIDGAEWENKDIHGIIKTNFYTSPDYSWVKTEYPFAIKKPFVVINNKFFRQWFQIYQAPLNYFDVKDIRLMVEMFKNYGYSVIYNHFIEETSIDQYFDFSFNDLKSDESFINLNDYYKNISNEERNKLQLSLFNDAEFVVGLQGGNMYLPALCKKNLWMLMRDGRYIDYLEFGRIYGIEVNVFYETWHLISAFKTYAENQNKYPVSTSNYIEKMQFAISGIKHPSTPIPPPFISICIPTYNRAEFIEEAIQSVLEQNYDNFEIVIVDDGSTDNTRQIVESIDSNKIRYYYKKHSGAPDTRNKCIKHSHGEFLLWLGDDDLLDKYALSSYYDYLKQYPSIDVIYGQLQSFGKSNYLYKYNDWWRKNDKMIEFLLIGSPIPDGGTLVRRSIYETLGYYDKHFNRAQDYEFWSRLALSEKFNCKYVPQITYKYRIHEKNITGELSKNTNYSYEIKILKNIISKAGVKKLFTQFDWNNSEIESFANAYTKISLRFFEWNSVDNALFYLLKSLDYGFSDEQEKILEVILKDLNVSKLYPELFKDLRDKHDYWVNEKNGSTITESVEVKRLGDLNNTVNEEKFVNICMVTYNRIEFTKQSIESVIKYPSYPYTLTVIDNNSEDGTKEYLEELKENGIIKNLILLEENVGVAKASNLAWSLEPEAEYYLKLDNDIVFEKVDWLKD